MELTKVDQVKSLLLSGENWIGNNIIIKDNCSCCDEFKLIDYVFLNGSKVLTQECLDCVSEEHQW